MSNRSLSSCRHEYSSQSEAKTSSCVLSLARIFWRHSSNERQRLKSSLCISIPVAMRWVWASMNPGIAYPPWRLRAVIALGNWLRLVALVFIIPFSRCNAQGVILRLPKSTHLTLSRMIELRGKRYVAKFTQLRSVLQDMSIQVDGALGSRYLWLSFRPYLRLLHII